MGVVYKAEDPRLKRQVALKFLTDERPVDARTLDRFRWEAQALSALNHPNICVIYDIGEEGGRPFIVMELLEGRSLRDIVAAGPMPADAAIDVGIQIADALGAAHARDIIHRDLKPANIFLTTRQQAKLLDFGLAKVVAEGELEQAVLAETGSFQAHTDPGFAMGTAGYMAPEQIRGEGVDARTDVFALGAVLYELITGRPRLHRTDTGHRPGRGAEPAARASAHAETGRAAEAGGADRALPREGPGSAVPECRRPSRRPAAPLARPHDAGNRHAGVVPSHDAGAARSVTAGADRGGSGDRARCGRPRGMVSARTCQPCRRSIPPARAIHGVTWPSPQARVLAGGQPESRSAGTAALARPSVSTRSSSTRALRCV